MDMLTTTGPMHVACMRQALDLARRCLPIPTAFCVGCLITRADSGDVLSTGYSRELEGNTHAEQCALKKLGATDGALDLYTTMEPCSVRLSGNLSCTELILEFNRRQEGVYIRNVYLGVIEPHDFVECEGVQKLSENGIRVVEVIGFKEDCLKVARGGTVNS